MVEGRCSSVTCQNHNGTSAAYSKKLRLVSQPDRQARSVAYHVIPVPQGWSAEQAWESIKRGDLLTDADPDWSIVRAENGRMVGLVELDDA